MSTLHLMDAVLVGLFGFAAVHYAIHWWFSRSERVLLVFALQCAVYTAFSVMMLSRHQATTVTEMQTATDGQMTLGPLLYIGVLQLYALLGGRRDAVFRTLVVSVLALLAVLNQWLPLRETVPALVAFYLCVLVVQLYGLVVARSIWKRGDRAGALLVALAAVTIEAAGGVAMLVRFAGLQAPHIGALPHVLFAICMALVRAREYSARALRARELREAKIEAERASAAKSAFLAQTTHEIRSSLGVMMLYAQLLDRDHALDDEQANIVDEILSSGKELTSLLGNVLDVSKIEAGRAELVEGLFDVWATLDEVEHMFSLQCAAQAIELRFERSAELPRWLHGDAAKMKQILVNLVGNAVKFTKHGGIRVTASATPQSDDAVLVKVVVADTGIGIAANDLARLFEPFAQLTSGARAGGTGLGLAISRTHARLMRGDLTVESELGVGSTFTFTARTRRGSVAVDQDRADVVELMAAK